jgi:hypothetical protein
MTLGRARGLRDAGWTAAAVDGLGQVVMCICVVTAPSPKKRKTRNQVLAMENKMQKREKGKLSKATRLSCSSISGSRQSHKKAYSTHSSPPRVVPRHRRAVPSRHKPRSHGPCGSRPTSCTHWHLDPPAKPRRTSFLLPETTRHVI